MMRNCPSKATKLILLEIHGGANIGLIFVSDRIRRFVGGNAPVPTTQKSTMEWTSNACTNPYSWSMEHAVLHHNSHELTALNLELYILDDAGGP